MNFEIYTTYTELYKLFINTALDINVISQILKLSFRHEFSHILDYDRFISKPLDDLIQYTDSVHVKPSDVKSMRKNASFNNRLSHHITYHNFPGEKTANHLVDIDENGIRRMVTIFYGLE